MKEYTVPSPDKFSIVRVSDTDRPANLMVHNVREVGEKKTFALVLYHYTMVKEGALVKWRLVGNASEANGHSQFGATPSGGVRRGSLSWLVRSRSRLTTCGTGPISLGMARSASRR